MDVEARTALISGGAGGLGAGLAQACAEAGMNVVIGDIDLQAAQACAAQIGDHALAIELDVTRADSWTDARDLVADRFGDVDLLCNNAGISIPPAPLANTDEADFDRIVAVNLKGVFNGIRTFADGMRMRGAGHIVNTASSAGLVAHSPFGSYTATKFAVMGLSECLRLELEPHGVGVSLLCPGLVRSKMTMATARRGIIEERHMMDPLWVGRAVIRAVREHRFYVFTHPEYREPVRERAAAMIAAFGDPAQPGFSGVTQLSLPSLANL